MEVRQTPYVITHRVQVFLDGTGLWQEGQWSSDPTEQAAAEGLLAKCIAAPARADRSVRVFLTDAEARIIRCYVTTMEMGGRDNAWDPDGRADMNAARALLRKLPA